jgi:uncharacterized protein
MAEARNVFGEPLAECCTKPMTGFYRDGSCNTGPEDFGMHTVCTRVDAAFLAFSQAAGNDLSTPVPEFGFPGSRHAEIGPCAPLHSVICSSGCGGAGPARATTQPVQWECPTSIA